MRICASRPLPIGEDSLEHSRASRCFLSASAVRSTLAASKPAPIGEDSWSKRMLDSAFGDFNEHTVEFLSFCLKGDLGADDARRFRSAANGEPHTVDSLSGI